MIITINGKQFQYSKKDLEGKSFLNLLQRENIDTAAYCGGNGKCGKCMIRVAAPATVIGSYKACQTFPVHYLEKGIGEMKIETQTAGKFSIPEAAPAATGISFSFNREPETQAGRRFPDSDLPLFASIAIDLGSTTIAAALIDEKSGRILGKDACLNSQRIYGADVISRIRASLEGVGDFLADSVRADLVRLSEKLLKGQRGITVRRILIGGNTAMIHLLLGYSCRGLAFYPFHPVTTDRLTFSAELLPFDREYQKAVRNCRIDIFPGFFAFTGGDLRAGLYRICRLYGDKCFPKDRTFLLADLGTNGELALYHADTLYLASAAMGPAFEGGNMGCGTGAVTGAIYDCKISGKMIFTRRFGYDNFERTDSVVSPGVCGSGMIALLAELLRNRLMDCDGLLRESPVDLGKQTDSQPLRLTQKDVREFQMAKSALRCGMELLLSEAGLTPDKIDTLFVSGSFGSRIDSAKATRLGMFPNVKADRIRPIGNSCLDGLILFLQDSASDESDLPDPCLTCEIKEIQPAVHPDFEKLYMRYMSFC